MNSRLSPIVLFSSCIMTTGCQNPDQQQKIIPDSPNIVIILADDLGYSDLHTYGNELVETPVLDRLAATGIKFTHAYASCPVCSPTRAALLTGKNPVAVDITDWIPGHQASRGIKPHEEYLVPEFNQQLPLEETTLAEKLKEKGYVTASIGKWHLGGEGYLPVDQGFDINIAGNHKGMPPSYHFPYTREGWDWTVSPLEERNDSLYLTDRLGLEAVNFIKDQSDTLFLLYLPFYTVHTPFEGRPDLVNKYRELIEMNTSDSITRNPEFLAMIECLDENVGKVISALEQEGIRDRTLIFFLSDNGGLDSGRGSQIWGSWNFPLRSGKGTLYEGGIRVPAIINWPGIVPQGMISDELMISTDVYPTLMELLDIPYTTDIEGVSFFEHITNGDPVNRETLYWHYPHYHRGEMGSVIRDGNYKLIRFYENERVELYDLNEDIGENHDLSRELPEVRDSLLKKLEQWKSANEAKMPSPNPDYRKN